MNLKPYAKAIVGGATAGLTALGTALADDHVTRLEWTIIAGAVLAGLGLVYAVPNRPAQ